MPLETEHGREPGFAGWVATGADLGTAAAAAFALGE
jgi:hypothetical protein